MADEPLPLIVGDYYGTPPRMQAALLAVVPEGTAVDKAMRRLSNYGYSCDVKASPADYLPYAGNNPRPDPDLVCRGEMHGAHLHCYRIGDGIDWWIWLQLEDGHTGNHVCSRYRYMDFL